MGGWLLLLLLPRPPLLHDDLPLGPEVGTAVGAGIGSAVGVGIDTAISVGVGIGMAVGVGIGTAVGVGIGTVVGVVFGGYKTSDLVRTRTQFEWTFVIMFSDFHNKWRFFAGGDDWQERDRSQDFGRLTCTNRWRSCTEPRNQVAINKQSDNMHQVFVGQLATTALVLRAQMTLISPPTVAGERWPPPNRPPHEPETQE
jgi:hypothetical protein